MRRYSPAEAIGPAWEHTTSLMWRDRRWLVGLKIALVALLAEIGGASANFNMGGRGHSNADLGKLAAVVAALAVVGFVLFILWLIFFYIGSRMQFVHFGIIAYRERAVQPLWQRYGGVTWRWIGFKFLLFLGMIVAMVPIFGALFLSAFHRTSTAQFPLKTFFVTFFLMMFAVLLFVCIYTAARDFVLPSVALEGTTVTFGIKRFFLWFQAEPGGILLFLFLRLLLGLVFAIIAYLTMFLALVASAIPFAVVGGMLWLPVRHASTSAQIAVGIPIALIVLCYVIWAFVLAVAILGTLMTFYIAWGLYYLGGRYPMLGDLLEPSYTLDAFTPPPSFPSRDDSSGPDLPLNPQPAS